jgi:hypothetical protein
MSEIDKLFAAAAAAAAAACILIAAAVAPLQQPRFNARAITFAFESAGFNIMLKSVVFANRRLSSVRAHGIGNLFPPHMP